MDEIKTSDDKVPIYEKYVINPDMTDRDLHDHYEKCAHTEDTSND